MGPVFSEDYGSTTLPLEHEGLGAAYFHKGNVDEAVPEYLNSIRHWAGSDKIIAALSAACRESGMP